MNEGDRATLSVVVVGAGGAGVSMLTRLTRRPDFKVGAVVDVDDAALELASRHTGVPGFRRLEDALTGGQAQLVYIATPSELHASHAELAMELGADVLVEKPMAVSVSEARHMIDVSDRTGRKLLVCHKRSADPGPRHICVWSAAGHTGRSG